MHCDAQEGEQIWYAGINSLYPYVNKNKTYPVGHPQILVNPKYQDVHSYFGIAKVKILAPAKLYHPVLPKMINNKLMFAQCGKCVQKQMERPWLKRTEICSHTEDQKAPYIQAYEEREGIKLENVEKNAGTKAVAKLMLNQ